jgi:hypothetical protein
MIKVGCGLNDENADVTADDIVDVFFRLSRQFGDIDDNNDIYGDNNDMYDDNDDSISC